MLLLETVCLILMSVAFNGCRVSYTIPGTPGKKTGIVDDTRD